MLAFIFVVVGITPDSGVAQSAEQLGPDEILVVVPPDPRASFQERRQNWGIRFLAGLEQYLPSAYRSPIDQATYGQLFRDDPVRLGQIAAGVVYRFSLISVYADVAVGIGSVTAGYSGERTTLSLQRRGADFGIGLDGFLPEPWLVPYITFRAFEMVYREADSRAEARGTVYLGTGYVGGVQVWLNWLDKDSIDTSRKTTGLENAFLDIFVSTYESATPSANLGSSLSWGGGLRLEF